MVSMMMVRGVRWWCRLRSWSATRTVGTDDVAGRYAVWAASKFGSSASSHIMRIVGTRMRVGMAATGIGWMMLSLGGIQSKHVEQNGGDIGHHDEGDEHDEPRENGEAAHAQLVQQNGEDGHDDDL